MMMMMMILMMMMMMMHADDDDDDDYDDDDAPAQGSAGTLKNVCWGSDHPPILGNRGNLVMRTRRTCSNMFVGRDMFLEKVPPSLKVECGSVFLDPSD